jgi:hypothetical protein
MTALPPEQDAFIGTLANRRSLTVDLRIHVVADPSSHGRGRQAAPAADLLLV